MNRRSFLKRLTTGIASVALAAHLKFGELVPVVPEIVEEPILISRIDVLTGWTKLYAEGAVRICS